MITFDSLITTIMRADVRTTTNQTTTPNLDAQKQKKKKQKLIRLHFRTCVQHMYHTSTQGASQRAFPSIYIDK